MSKNNSLKKIMVVVLSVLMMLVMLATINYDTSFAAKKSKVVYEIKKPNVSAGSYIVMSGSTSEVVYEKHSERKLPIGNITKLMTAMVVIDNIHDVSEYDNSVEITSKISKYGDDFKKGDYISVQDLLEAMIVGGSNEAAEALARYSASKRNIFVSEMNSKAMELGLMSTQYANPTGLYNADHYSTAEESAVVAQAAIRYEKIKELFMLDSVGVDIKRGKKNKTKTFTNTNPLLSSTKPAHQYDYIKGGILGSLTEPRNYSQYAGIATKDDMQLVVVMLEANEGAVADGAIGLFDYGFANVTKNTIVKAGKCLGKAKVKGGTITRVKGYTETKGFAYIPPEGSADLVMTEVVMEEGLVAPLKAGSKVGEYRIYVADELKGTVDLVTKKDVGKGWILSNIYISNFATVVILIVVIGGGFLILRARFRNKRKARLRERDRQAKIREMAMKQEALDEDRKNRHWTYSNYYDNKDINDKL